MYFANRRLRCESSQEQRHELEKHLTISSKLYVAGKVLQDAHYTAKFSGKDTYNIADIVNCFSSTCRCSCLLSYLRRLLVKYID